MIGTKEFYELVEQFEEFASKNLRGRLDKEDGFFDKNKKVKVWYCDGEVNDAFKSYMYGYSYGKAVHMH